MDDVTAQYPLPIRYVNLLLYQMERKNTASLTISESELLPMVSGLEENSPLPKFTQARNRLKVMSGLNPSTYQEPVVGTITILIAGAQHIAEVHFDDKAEYPSCRIELSKKDS